MKNLFGIILLFLFSFGLYSQNVWYVSPDGTSSGDGSINNPWDLQTALSQPASVQPGDTILLMSGIYKGSYKSYLKGTSSERITVKAYDKRNPPVLDRWEWTLYNLGVAQQQTLIAKGAYTDYVGIAIISSCPYHFSLITGSNPATSITSQGIYVYGTHINVINCFVFYQNGVGIGFWAQNDGGIEYGNIVGLNGRVSTDRGHGQGSYVQNLPGADYKHLENNIWFKSCSYGMKIYAQADKVHNVYVENNISFLNGTPSWSYDGNKDIEIYAGDMTDEGNGSNIIIRNNSTYQLDTARNAGIAANVYGVATNFNIVGNTIVNGLYAFKTHGLEEGSRVDSNFIYSAASEIAFSLEKGQVDAGFLSWDNNTYYQRDPSLESAPFEYPYTSFTTWQNNHPSFDQNSTFTKGEPTSNIINIYPNKYEAGRAHVAIYNFTGVSTQAVDLSSVCNIGDSVIIYDVEHLFGDNAILKTVYDGSLVDFPLNLSQQDSIPEYSDDVHHSPEDFNAYLVISYSLNLPVINKGKNHVKTKIVIDRFIDNNNGTYTVDFHDLAPYDGVKYRVMVQTKSEGPAEDYKVYDDISSGFTFNMLEDFPETGTQNFVVGVMNDSTYTEIEFSYISYRNEEMVHAAIRSDELMAVHYFNPNSGNSEYGYLYDEAGNLLGDSVYHISVSGVNTIYLKYYYKNDIEYTTEKKYRMVVKNFTTGWSDSICVDKTMYDYNALHIFNWSYDDHFDKTVLKYYRGQNYWDSLRLFNSNDELLRTFDTYSYVGDNVYIIDLSSYPSDTYKVILSDGHTSDTAIYIKGTPPTLSITDCSPDPTYGEFTVRFRSEKSGDINVEVLNANDKSVWQKSITVAEGKDSVVVDITAEQEGTYMVKLYNGTDSDSCTVTKLDLPPVLSIDSYYPKVTYDTVAVVFSSPGEGNIDVILTNSSGEKVYSEVYSALAGTNSLELYLASYPAGEYTISLSDGTTTVTCTVTKQDRPRELEIIGFSPDTTINTVTVAFYSPRNGSVTVSAYNSSGTQVLSKGITAEQGEGNSVEIDLSGNNAGVYTIKLNDGTSEVSCQVTKVDPPRPLEIISYSPNPTYDKVTIRFYSPKDAGIRIVVVNSAGNEVYSGGFSAKEGDANNIDVDLSQYEAGIYIIKLSDDVTDVSCEVTKQNITPPPVSLSIKDYPETTTGVAEITVNVSSDGALTLKVFNNNSQIVLDNNYNVVEGDNKINIDLSSLPAEKYKVQVTYDTQSAFCYITKLEPIKFKLLSVSPDPTSGVCFLKITSPEKISLHIEVYNDMGNMVHQEYDIVIEGENNIPLDLSDKLTGRYLITIDNGSDKQEIYVTKQSYLE